MASASPRVSGLGVAHILGELPRKTNSRLVPMPWIEPVIVFLRAAADRQHGDHRRHADHDAQNGQAGAQLVGRQALQRFDKRLAERSCRYSSTTTPSRRRITRWVCAATSGSWVTMISVVPRSRFKREQQLHDLLARFGVQVAGRLVGHDDGRVVDQRAGDGHALLLPAGKLVGAVVHAVAQPDRFERRPAPARCARWSLPA